MNALDLGLNLDLERGVGLCLDAGLGWRFTVLLLLHENLVVQELELGWVPVNQAKPKIRDQLTEDTIKGEYERGSVQSM